MKNPKKKEIRLNIIIDVKYLKGKRDKHGCENLAFVFYGVNWTPRKVSTVYRRRFAIESSYRSATRSYNMNCENAIPSIWDNPTMTCVDGNVRV